jgi:hypothetical protein
MEKLLLILLMFTLPARPMASDPIKDEVDLVEINHYMDDGGKRILVQLLFKDWSSQLKRYIIREWRLIKSEDFNIDENKIYPFYKDGKYMVRWHDSSEGLREVTCTNKSESWTRYDPEVKEDIQAPRSQRKSFKPFYKIPEDNVLNKLNGFIKIDLF